MLAIKIDNLEIENKFLEYAKTHHKAIEDIALEAIQYFISIQQKDRLVYTKKDPLKHIHKVNRDFDNEDLSDVKPYMHILDSAEYIHNLRRKRNY